jgi:hypothetical protein
MPTWHTGQAWRVVNSLNKLNEQIRAYAPRAVPPATNVDSWGSIADNVHSTSSDHYPHYYGALGSTAVVCARDFPHAPGLGLDGGVVTEHMRQVRDSRVQYIIFNRRITGVNYGWQWHTYIGDDPHNTHFHVSCVHSAIADSTAAWSLPGSSSTSFGDSMDFMMVANAADPHNGGIYVATPNGPVNINPGEYGSVSQAARDATMRVSSYERVMQLSPIVGAAQVTVTDEQFTTLTQAIVEQVRQSVGESIPADLDIETHVVNALQSSLGQAALVAAANTAAANTAAANGAAGNGAAGNGARVPSQPTG